MPKTPPCPISLGSGQPSSVHQRSPPPSRLPLLLRFRRATILSGENPSSIHSPSPIHITPQPPATDPPPLTRPHPHLPHPWHSQCPQPPSIASTGTDLHHRPFLSPSSTGSNGLPPDLPPWLAISDATPPASLHPLLSKVALNHTPHCIFPISAHATSHIPLWIPAPLHRSPPIGHPKRATFSSIFDEIPVPFRPLLTTIEPPSWTSKLPPSTAPPSASPRGC